ncbi:MAG: HAD family hydrolase [Verrucomicrobia bacterium]|nr:HAD family hydrolase [Verrucomicrobiota bacterium]
MLTAVLFDLDNTLIDRDRAVRECVCDQFSNPAVCAELLVLDEGGYGDRQKLFATWQEYAGTPIDQQSFGRLIAERIQPDRELLNALHSLSKLFKLGIITNGGSENQRGKFCAAGLSEVIPNECLWVSAELGMTKPDPRLFLFASRALNEPPEHCLYIGDHQNDLAGAKSAGMRARIVDGVLDASRVNAIIASEHLQ